jgi:hypothetical protein
VRRVRAVNTSVGARTPGVEHSARAPVPSAKSQVKAAAGAQISPVRQRKTPAPVQPQPVQTVRNSVQPGVAQDDADLASDLIASGVTTKPVETVIAVLAARREGASINAAAKALGINYRTAQRIASGSLLRPVETAPRRQRVGLRGSPGVSAVNLRLPITAPATEEPRPRDLVRQFDEHRCRDADCQLRPARQRSETSGARRAVAAILGG